MTRSALDTLPTDLTCEQARVLTDTINATLGSLWRQLVKAWEGRAWVALGYASWDAYCAAELDTDHFKLPRAERREVVASMREAGMSTRAIAAATGVDPKTVRNDSGGDFSPPAPVVGRDGKTYNPKTSTPDTEVIDAEIVNEPRRIRLPDRSREAVAERRRVLTEMAGQGYTSRQIAERLDITEQRTRGIARDIGVDIAADRVTPKSHRLNTQRVLSELLLSVEGACMGIGLIDAAAIEQVERDEAAQRLTQVISQLTGLRRTLA